MAGKIANALLFYINETEGFLRGIPTGWVGICGPWGSLFDLLTLRGFLGLTHPGDHAKKCVDVWKNGTQSHTHDVSMCHSFCLFLFIAVSLATVRWLSRAHQHLQLLVDVNRLLGCYSSGAEDRDEGDSRVVGRELAHLALEQPLGNDTAGERRVLHLCRQVAAHEGELHEQLDAAAVGRQLCGRRLHGSGGT